MELFAVIIFGLKQETYMRYDSTKLGVAEVEAMARSIGGTLCGIVGRKSVPHSALKEAYGQM